MAILEYTIASLLTLMALSSAKHLYTLSTKAGFSAKKNLTNEYRDFLIKEDFQINKNHALIKNKFSDILTYNTRYTLGHNPQMYYVNYYFQIKFKEGSEKTLESLKKRLSIFYGYHNFSWKNAGDSLTVVYVKSNRTAPGITAIEFDEIVSSLGGSK